MLSRRARALATEHQTEWFLRCWFATLPGVWVVCLVVVFQHVGSFGLGKGPGGPRAHQQPSIRRAVVAVDYDRPRETRLAKGTCNLRQLDGHWPRGRPCAKTITLAMLFKLAMGHGRRRGRRAASRPTLSVRVGQHLLPAVVVPQRNVRFTLMCPACYQWIDMYCGELRRFALERFVVH